MAMIDYGAILRIKESNSDNWNFINKDNTLFMEHSDTGYICEKAIDKDGTDRKIAGNYFVYAGDEHFCLAFYKTQFVIISDGKILHSKWDFPFSSETLYFHDLNLPDVEITRLDKTHYSDKDSYKIWENWDEYVKFHWEEADGNTPLSDLQNGRREYREFCKKTKRFRHQKAWKYYNQRYLAKWTYNGKDYEVIFGYGIDPEKEVWNDTKESSYNFSEIEKEQIDVWFEDR